MADYRVTGVTQLDGRVTKICGPGWDTMDASTATALIRIGYRFYVRLAGGQEVDLIDVAGPHGPYLRTTGDTTVVNNLDSLPPC